MELITMTEEGTRDYNAINGIKLYSCDSDNMDVEVWWSDKCESLFIDMMGMGLILEFSPTQWQELKGIITKIVLPDSSKLNGYDVIIHNDADYIITVAKFPGSSFIMPGLFFIRRRFVMSFYECEWLEFVKIFQCVSIPSPGRVGGNAAGDLGSYYKN